MHALAFKTAWRSLRNRPAVTLLNIAGLGVSLGVALLVLMFIRDQWRIDRFHTDADRIHRISTTHQGRLYATSPAPLAGMLRDAEVAGVEAVSALARDVSTFVVDGEQSIAVRALIADAEFWKVFNGIPLLRGSRTTALSEPMTAVLSAETARELYGSENPVGKTLLRAGEQEYTVVGVMAPLPDPSHVSADVLFSPPSTGPSTDAASAHWERMFSQYTYVRLAPGTAAASVLASAQALFDQHASPRVKERSSLHRMSLADLRFGDMHSNEIHPRTQLPVWMFGVLGVLAAIGVIAAAFNYVNLTVAHSLDRAREIGVRKTLGAHRRQLMTQFLGEAVLTSLLAGGVAGALFITASPAFNNLFIFNLMRIDAVDASELADPAVLGLIALVCIGTGLIAGLYPALRLSGFNPARSLKGQGKSLSGSSRLRKGLIAGQIVFSLVLLVTAATFFQQTRYMANADHELRTERLVSVALEDVSYESFRDAVDGLPDVEMTAAVSHLMLGPSNYSSRDILLPGETERQDVVYFSVDTSFVANMGLTLRASRPNWQAALASEDGMLFNASAARLFGYESASAMLGQTVTFPSQARQTRTVVGIVNDFEVSGIAEVYTSNDRFGRDKPMMLYWSPENASHALVRSRSGNLAALRDRLEATWTNRIATAHPFSARFYSDITRMRYGPLQDAALLTSSVAGLAILIAILGLLSLAAHHVRTRRKEIGVRKALGARVQDVTLELSKGFAGIVAGAALLTLPLAWLLNRWWLQFFSDRIDLSVLMIAACALGLVALSLAVIASQTIRAARLDPTLCLRDD